MAAVIVIFAIYVGASAGLIHFLIGAREESGKSLRDYVASAADIRLTVEWASVALAVGVGCVALSGWSMAILRRYLLRRDFWRAFATLSLLAVIATRLSIASPGGTLALPHRLTCGGHPLIIAPRGFLCGYLLAIDWRSLLGGEGWISLIVVLRLVSNILFQTAAIGVLGAMMILAANAASRQRPAGYERLLARDLVMVRLFAAAALILSTHVLSEIVFLNWPIAAVGDAELIGLLKAYELFFAMLGTIALALALVFARTLVGGAVPFVTTDPGSPWGRATRRLGGVLKKETTLNALMALSPLLTGAIGGPLVKALLAG